MTLAIMLSGCHCGCGRSFAFGRAAALNDAAALAAARLARPALPTAVRGRGDALLRAARATLHDDRPVSPDAIGELVAWAHPERQVRGRG